MKKHKVVVIGGGFAGLNFLKGLANHPAFEVTLVDKNNYHYFPPLLYQVGMAFIEVSNIAYPFRRFFQRRKNIRFHYGVLVRVDTENRLVYTEWEKLSYDFLIIAHGTETNFFGMERVKRHALPLKTIRDALNLRNHLLINAERAISCDDPEEKKRLLNVVIAGGGPTGVEIAGMLAEMIHKIGPKEYPEISKGTFRIYLVQSGPVLLNNMSVKAQNESLKILTDLGVSILLNTRVIDYEDGAVVLSNGRRIGTNALLWTSGVVARKTPGLPETCLGHGRRIVVDEFSRVVGMENIFAIGDVSLSKSDPGYPEGHPQLAQVAIQQGKVLASNLKRGVKNEQWIPFKYRDKGTMAIISKYRAVADLPKASFKGFGAWLLWLFIHLIPIAGFRNKFDLISNWIWSYITNDPTLRLIIRRDRADPTPRPGELPVSGMERAGDRSIPVHAEKSN